MRKKNNRKKQVFSLQVMRRNAQIWPFLIIVCYDTTFAILKRVIIEIVSNIIIFMLLQDWCIEPTTISNINHVSNGICVIEHVEHAHDVSPLDHNKWSES